MPARRARRSLTTQITESAFATAFSLLAFTFNLLALIVTTLMNARNNQGQHQIIYPDHHGQREADASYHRMMQTLGRVSSNPAIEHHETAQAVAAVQRTHSMSDLSKTLIEEVKDKLQAFALKIENEHGKEVLQPENKAILSDLVTARSLYNCLNGIYSVERMRRNFAIILGHRSGIQLGDELASIVAFAVGHNQRERSCFTRH